MKNKKLYVLIILMVLVTPLLILTVNAGDIYRGECGDNATFTLDIDTGELIISGFGPMKSYGFDDMPWRHYRNMIRTVTVEQGITSIGSNAFYSCEELTVVKLPDSLIKIEMWAFNQCRALSSVNLPESLTEIGIGAFNCCNSLTKIDIPNSVTTIGSSAFAQSGIRSLIIPEGIVEIEAICSGCLDLEAVTLPNSLKRIGDSTFNGCQKLAEINIPKNVSEIGYAAFLACYELADIEIPAKVTEIRESAFSYCTALTYVALPKGVTTIGASAFAHCTNLSEIVFPEKCESVGMNAFIDCPALRSIHITSAEAWLGISFENLDATPLSTRGSVLLINEEPLTILTVPEGVTKISNYNFAWCNTLTSVSLPESLTEIGEGAFYACWELTEINIPKGVTEIKYLTFVDCEFPKLILPEGLIKIEEASLTGNDSIEELIIPDGVTHIGDMAFIGCTSLKKVVFPDSLVSIGGSIFDLCDNVERVFFFGTEEQWKKVSVGTDNKLLTEKLIIHSDHVYDRELAEERYLKTAANCDSYAIYYKSCICDAKGEETFMGTEFGHMGGTATCLTRATCEICGDQYGDIGSHDYVDEITFPTCTEEGIVISTCSACQQTYTKQSIPPTGHRDSPWIIDEVPTLFKVGKKHKICVVCGETLQNAEIDRLTLAQRFGCASSVGGSVFATLAAALSVSYLFLRKKRK